MPSPPTIVKKRTLGRLHPSGATPTTVMLNLRWKACVPFFMASCSGWSAVMGSAEGANGGAAGALHLAPARATWAAPAQPFMRREGEDALRKAWRAARKETRLACKKMHHDAVRRQRKHRDRQAGAGRRGGSR